MKQLTTTILAVALFCACGNNTAPNDHEFIELSDAEIICISNDTPRQICADQAEKIDLQDLIAMTSSIDYIKLDSSEPIGTINKMIVTEGKIFILDAYVAQEIFAFDKTGKLLFRIKNKGRGPNEYLSIRDMQFDAMRNEILVNDPWAKSCLYYSAADGQFLRRERTTANIFLAHLNGLYINLTGNGQDYNEKENWSILVSDKDSVIYKGFEVEPIQSGNYLINSFTHDFDGNLLYTPVYSDTVYQFKSPSKVLPKYVISHEKSIWKLHNQWLPFEEIIKLIKENNYTQYDGKFYDTEDFGYFALMVKFGEFITAKPYFWDKRTDVVYEWDMARNDDLLPFAQYIITQPSTVYNNTFIGYFPSGGVDEKYKKNLNPKLKKMLDDSDDGDNPIVVCYKLK